MREIRKVLIANRGEIALRIIRACRELGVKPVTVYSDVDAGSLPVRLSDSSYALGGSEPSESYLNIEKIIKIARLSGVDAVHPGYGFLSENPLFAKRCEEEGIIFIGPSSRTLELAGNKVECRRVVSSAGVPTVPGVDRPVELEEALSFADKVGYPVMLKAVYGGGGRGIRVVNNPEELRQAYSIAAAEAGTAFGRTALYVEKIIKPARHIEFQILADRSGNVVHLHERECSIQRRFQKLVEISPSPALDEELRATMGEVAVAAARAINYMNAGTIEFLLDRERRLYFIEVNARLQVEHPVTEMRTGIDIVKQQILLAGGEALPFSQDEIRPIGAAIECRINAEDPLSDFAPSTGRVIRLHIPNGPGVRVDTALYEGMELSAFYDSLIAKLVCWGVSFEEARRRCLRALNEMRIEGIATTAPLHKAVLEDRDFISGNLDTDFIERRKILEKVKKQIEEEKNSVQLYAVAAAIAYFRNNMQRPTRQEQTRERRRIVGARYYDLI